MNGSQEQEVDRFVHRLSQPHPKSKSKYNTPIATKVTPWRMMMILLRLRPGEGDGVSWGACCPGKLDSDLA